MICCDACDEWFHHKCINLKVRDDQNVSNVKSIHVRELHLNERYQHAKTYLEFCLERQLTLKQNL